MPDANIRTLLGPNLPNALLHRLFSEANDAVLRTPARVLDEIVMQSGMATSGLNTSWFDHPSNKRILLYVAAVNGHDRRRNGNKWVVAHDAGVANKVANDPELLKDGEDKNFLAFRAAIHDIGEAAKALRAKGLKIDAGLTISYAVGHWQNSDKALEARQREIAEKSAKNLMDREEGDQRLLFQAEITAASEKVDQHIRVYDKIDQVEGDRDFYLGELISFNQMIQNGQQFDPDKLHKIALRCQKDFENALGRRVVVNAAHLVRDELKQRHKSAMDTLELLAEELHEPDKQYGPEENHVAAAGQTTQGSSRIICTRSTTALSACVPTDKCAL